MSTLTIDGDAAMIQPDWRRRSILKFGAAGLVPLAFPACVAVQPRSRPKVVGLFSGVLMDRGFMEAGYRGLERARDELDVDIDYVDQITPRREILAEALRKLAQQAPDFIVAHGGQNNEAAKLVAAEFPRVQFVVTQGDVTGPNLASYEVLQEHSAWLGGALAGMWTKTNVVGHMSGIRVTPGLKGRASFAAGLRHVNPRAKLLTNFSGNQDDAALAKRIASAEIHGGADIIFSMLNAGRIGAIEASRERKIRHIANVRDWYPDAPDVILASAVADTSFAVFNAVRDFRHGKLKVTAVEHIGLEQPAAVRLALAPDVPASMAAEIQKLSAGIQKGQINVPVTYSGEEFVVK
jgi:basic membrane protein A